MKRLNPKTGRTFKQGEKREDGRIFYSYRSTKNKNGYNREDWITEESYRKIKEKVRTTQKEQEKFSREKEESGDGFRVSPITGKPFQEGDVREDGYVFVSYRSVKNKNGFYREDWAHPDVFKRQKQKKKSTQQKQAELAKTLREQGNVNLRLNPETNAPFKRGDIENGKYFWEYRQRSVRKSGTVPEIWHTQEEFERQSKYFSDYVEARSREGLNEATEGKLVKRLNPQTGKPFVSGDRRESDGWRFGSYSSRIQADGFMQELWSSPEAWLKKRIGHTFRLALDRAQKKKIPFDVTVEHLHDIFPKDYRCPILGTLMEWGAKGGKRTSPSLDRIIPDKGYVKGNLVWISDRANSIKSDGTIEEHRLVIKWMKKN
jgi:hypothetical protein